MNNGPRGGFRVLEQVGKKEEKRFRESIMTIFPAFSFPFFSNVNPHKVYPCRKSGSCGPDQLDDKNFGTFLRVF